MPSYKLISSTVITVVLLSIFVPAIAKTEHPHPTPKAAEGADIIGTKAPEFADLVWVNSKPLTIANLKGKPVLLRFWLGHCDMCERSMPALNYLHKKYKDRGL